MAEPRPLLPSTGDAALPASARDRSSHSPAPSLPAKKVAIAADRGSSPGPSVLATKKKAAVDRGTRRPAPSSTHPPPKIMSSPVLWRTKKLRKNTPSTLGNPIHHIVAVASIFSGCLSV